MEEKRPSIHREKREKGEKTNGTGGVTKQKKMNAPSTSPPDTVTKHTNNTRTRVGSNDSSSAIIAQTPATCFEEPRLIGGALGWRALQCGHLSAWELIDMAQMGQT